MKTPILQVESLVVEFSLGKNKKVHTVSDVSLEVAEGETLGLVGESGCGKSTLGRAILQAPRPTSGSVVFDGTELTTMQDKALRYIRPKLQLIVQDPISALNPRRRIADIVSEPLEIWSQNDKGQIRKRVAEALDSVGLDIDSVESRRPFEFSGGQCQRINIARALVMEPKVLICDEPVSALDVSVRAQIINLLEAAKARYGLAMLFVGHDLAIVKNISDRIAVMYLGKICELAPSDDLYRLPAHPYTAALLNSVPDPLPPVPGSSSKKVLEGELPSAIDPPSGCRFRTRCAHATQQCTDQEPEMHEIAPGHLVACHYPLLPEHPRPVRFAVSPNRTEQQA